MHLFPSADLIHLFVIEAENSGKTDPRPLKNADLGTSLAKPASGAFHPFLGCQPFGIFSDWKPHEMFTTKKMMLPILTSNKNFG